MRTAVVLSAHVIGLGVARALGAGGIPVALGSYSQLDMGVASRFASEVFSIPPPEAQEAACIKALLEFGARHPGAVLFPVDDATLSAVSRHKEELASAYVVACADWATARRVIDKKYTYQLARELGVPKPRTIAPANVKEAAAAAREIGYPCLVKPRSSHLYVECLGKKAAWVREESELLAAFEEARHFGLDILIQEFIPGEDWHGVNYNSYAVEGEVCVEFTAQKVRLAPAQLGIPRVVMSKSIPEVVPLGRKLLKALRFTGYSCIEFKLDAKSGTYRLLEINGRHNRSTLLSTRCGINFPLLEYRHRLLGEKPEPATFTEGIYWIDEFMEAAYNTGHFFRERYSPLSYFKPYLRPHVFAVFDRRDPGPFKKRVADLYARLKNHLAPFRRPGVPETTLLKPGL